MICITNKCRSGRIACPTPLMCGKRDGGTYWPAECARQDEDGYLSTIGTAFVVAIVSAVCLLVALAMALKG